MPTAMKPIHSRPRAKTEIGVYRSILQTHTFTAAFRELNMKAEIIFDGGGNSYTPCYGSYSIQIGDDKPFLVERLPLPEANTSNQAEYLCLIKALDNLLYLLKATHVNPARVKLTVKGDSELVIRQINGQYRCKDDAMYDLCSRACELLRNFNIATTVEWHARRNSVATFGH